MPLYDFQCDSCSEEFEAFAPGEPDGSEERTRCPSCSSVEVLRFFPSRVAAYTSAQRRGRVVDLSSGGCPCGSQGHGHAHARH
jgi:putative FmdB family regulatory protein